MPTTSPHAALEYWPVLATAGAGLVAWGAIYQRVQRAEDDIKTRASKEVVEQGFANTKDGINRLEAKIDRLLEGK